MNIKNVIKNIFSNPTSFFFRNLGTKQIIAKNTFWLATAEAITRFLKFFLIIYVARILGATEYGKFTFALAFVALFAVFSDLGISTITTRELAKNKSKEKDFSAIFSLKLLLAIGTLTIICLGSFFITLEPEIRSIIWVLGIYIVISGFSEIIYAFFRARQKMEYEAWTKIIQALAVTGAGFFVLFNLPSVKNLSFAYLIASSVALIFILIFFNFKVSRLHFSFNRQIWKNILSLSWPLALAGVFGTVYNSIDSVMMGYWGQITQVGWYNAAYKIIGVTLIPAGLIGTSFFPLLSKRLKESKQEFQKIWHYYLEIMIFLAVPIVAGGVALAPKIINFVYGPKYSPATLAFQILIIMAGLIFLLIPFSQALVVSNQQKKLFLITMSGAIVNMFLNFILIPKYSLYGAAVATLITYFLIFLLYIGFTIKFTPIKRCNSKLLYTFLLAIISSTLMCLVVFSSVICNLHIVYIVLLASLFYFFSFFIFQKVLNYFIK
jgi:O-antigen/teichoic acid export membrane protein